MRKLVAVAVALCALSSVAPGWAATPAERRIAKLEKQVKTLTKEVKKLRRDVNRANSEVNINYVADACQTAMVADTIRNTWAVIDQISSVAQNGKTYFGPQQVTNDKNACKDLRLTRVETQVPPPLSVFVALINYLII
jgi:outer membrane murein-binding lipoprotein Lpp